MEIYQENGLYGLKNDCGVVVISPQYIEFYPFSCGLACVRNCSYQYAYINIFNKTVVPFGKYIWVDPQFIGGYARVKTNDNKYWGIIDSTVKIAVIPNLDYIRPLTVKPCSIKGWGDCVHVNGIYSGKPVGYVIDRMSRINLPIDFEFEPELDLEYELKSLKPMEKQSSKRGLYTSISDNENLAGDEEHRSEYEEYRLDALEGDESNHWNIE